MINKKFILIFFMLTVSLMFIGFINAEACCIDTDTYGVNYCYGSQTSCSDLSAANCKLAKDYDAGCDYHFDNLAPVCDSTSYPNYDCSKISSFSSCNLLINSGVCEAYYFSCANIDEESTCSGLEKAGCFWNIPLNEISWNGLVSCVAGQIVSWSKSAPQSYTFTIPKGVTSIVIKELSSNGEITINGVKTNGPLSNKIYSVTPESKIGISIKSSSGKIEINYVCPGGEICDDNLDNDCDGTIDEGCTSPPGEKYIDCDNDGWGGVSLKSLEHFWNYENSPYPSSNDYYSEYLNQQGCDNTNRNWGSSDLLNSLFVTKKIGDCNDFSITIYPNAQETCNDNLDNQCPGNTGYGQVDENCCVTCTSLGYTCGAVSDNCGGTLQCGVCPTGKTCYSGKCSSVVLPIVAYWTDSKLIKINDINKHAIDKKRIFLIVENIPDDLTEIRLDIYEDDLIGDDQIRVGVNGLKPIKQSNGNWTAEWNVNSIDIDKSKDFLDGNPYKFYFKIIDEQTNQEITP